MKSVCIIPARGGSKRIPKKNIKLFRGKPLINWIINIAKESKCFDKIIVSTNDIEIANLSKSEGAEVPFLRPENLSDDFSSTLDVMKFMVRELLNGNSNLKYVCCMYATAPLILGSDLDKSFKMIQKMNYKRIHFQFTKI